MEAPSGGTPGAAVDYRVYRADLGAETPGVPGIEVSSKAAPQGVLSSIALVHTPTPAYQDTAISVGHTYRYVVRSVAQFGADMVESLDSNDAIVSVMDIFPPAAPQDLVAVIVPATLGAPTYVELSWSISPEADLAGYQVYRSEQPDAQGQLLNSELLSVPTFRDINVTAGQRYFYRVRAVDHAGNESPFSAGAEADLAGRQP